MKKKGLNGNLFAGGRVLQMTGAWDEGPTDEREPGWGVVRLSGKGKSCGWGGLGGGQGQRRVPYFFMRATLTEQRENEWPVKTNEKE